MFIEYFNKLIEDVNILPTITYEQFKNIYEYAFVKSFSDIDHKRKFKIIAENIYTYGHDPITFAKYKQLTPRDFAERIGDISNDNVVKYRNNAVLFTLAQFSDSNYTKLENIFVRDLQRTLKDVLRGKYTTRYQDLCIKIPEGYSSKNIPIRTKIARIGVKEGDPFGINGQSCIYDRRYIKNVKIGYFKEDPCLCNSSEASLSNLIVCFTL